MEPKKTKLDSLEFEIRLHRKATNSFLSVKLFFNSDEFYQIDTADRYKMVSITAHNLQKSHFPGWGVIGVTKK